MSPHRVAAAAAATVSPYPFDARQEHHGQGQAGPTTTTVTENAADRSGPHVKGKKTKQKPRAERNARQEEEIRFNVGPRNIRSPPASRGARRGFRIPGRAYPEDRNGVPDYPPPSFQEAMTTPPVSVCSSTASLPLAPATTVPLQIPDIIPEEPRERNELATVPLVAENPPSDNDLDFEGSMFVIDRNSIPVCSTDLPRGVALEERVKMDWLRRRGVEFPGKGSSGDLLTLNKSTDKVNVPTRGRALTKQLAPLLIDPDPKDDKSDLPSPVSSPKRRFLSLSPLRTIFPPRSPTQQERASLSAHPSPSPSPYHTSRSLFFRSSTSLSTASILKLPLLPSPTPGKGDNVSRKIFKGKGAKSQRNPEVDGAEDLEQNWEYLDEHEYYGVDKDGKERKEHPRSLLSAVESIRTRYAVGETSPTRRRSFTFGAQAANLARGKQPLVAPNSTDQGTSHMMSTRAEQDDVLRDWKGPSRAFVDRPLSRSRSPTPAVGISEIPTHMTQSIQPISNPHPPEPPSLSMYGPPLTTVRMRPTFPTSPPTPSLKRTAHVTHPSPLRVDMAGQSAQDVNAYQRALDTPLPVTPVVDSHFDNGGKEESIEIGVTSISGHSLVMGLTKPLSKTSSALPATLTVLTPSSANLAAPTSVTRADSLDEPMTPTRHHYVGRPLPRPPANASRVGVVDSLYASPESPINLTGGKNGSSSNICPEGLLIDLDDTTLDTIPGSGASTPRSIDEAPLAANSPGYGLAAPHISQASSSSVDLLIDHPSFASSSIQRTSTPLLPTSTDPSPHVPQSSGFPELTDLDLLVSRIADEDRRDGSDYETLLLVSELIGPANRPPAGSMTDNNTNNNHSSRSTPSSQRVNPNNGNICLIGLIEEMRRRVNRNGVVKLKLTLLDVAVNKCGICLSQFRDKERAALTAVCQHSFHEGCVERWLARSKTCPLCRIPLDMDVR